MILAQITPDQITTGVTIGGVIYLFKSLFELWAGYREAQDRKHTREEMIRLTELQNTLVRELVEIRQNQLTKDDARHICKGHSR